MLNVLRKLPRINRNFALDGPLEASLATFGSWRFRTTFYERLKHFCAVRTYACASLSTYFRLFCFLFVCFLLSNLRLKTDSKHYFRSLHMPAMCRPFISFLPARKFGWEQKTKRAEMRGNACCSSFKCKFLFTV